MMDMYTHSAHNEFRHADRHTPATVEGWKRVAQAHVAAVADPAFSAADDYALFHGLSKGLYIADVAAARLLVPNDVVRRFQALRNGLLDRNGIFQINAQLALLEVLKERVS